MKKKIAAALVAFITLITLLPPSVFADTALTELWVGGVQVPVGTPSADTGWSYDGAGTLTLDSAYINGIVRAESSTDYSENKKFYYRYESGIYADGDLNIVLNGSNSISAYNAADHEFSGGSNTNFPNSRLSAAIYCFGNLNISGTGSLTVYNKVLDEPSYQVEYSSVSNEPSSIYGFLSMTAA